jgi:uncharacterized protein YecE (DUF72 family)
MKPGTIRVGMGGWSYEPWRETFYPPEVKAKQELEYASRQVTAIEINSTFYRLQKPAVFAKWRDATPNDFVFSLKAPRFVTQRKALVEGIGGAQRFLESGVLELGPKLGPIVWQLAPTHRFEADDLAAFLEALPKAMNGQALRHVLNVRDESFRDSSFIALIRRCDVAVVFEDDEKYPAIADVSGDFVYARLRRCESSMPTGYSKPALQKWMKAVKAWASGTAPEDLRLTKGAPPANEKPRDVFVYFINGAKERAPAAARELLALLTK